jgi:hypothetical protein
MQQTSTRAETGGSAITCWYLAGTAAAAAAVSGAELGANVKVSGVHQFQVNKLVQRSCAPLRQRISM